MDRRSKPRRTICFGLRQLAAFGLVLAVLITIGLPVRDVVAVRARAYVYPLMGTVVSSEFGNRFHPIKHAMKHHDGLDLAAPMSAPIRAIANGRVIFAGPYSGYGNLVVLKHEDGMTSHYGHCSLIKAKLGSYVRAGQIIAEVGSTGISTGPHLHFEIRINGEPRNPEGFIPGLALPGVG